MRPRSASRLIVSWLCPDAGAVVPLACLAVAAMAATVNASSANARPGKNDRKGRNEAARWLVMLLREGYVRQNYDGSVGAVAISLSGGPSERPGGRAARSPASPRTRATAR